MKMKQLTLATAASLALCFTAATAFAGGDVYDTTPKCCNKSSYNGNWATGWYIGAGANGDAGMTDETTLGQASWQGTLAFSQQSFEKTENNVGFDVYVGRKVSKMFAFEMGYTWVGNQHFKAYNLATDTEDKAEVKQWNVHGIGLVHIPIGDYFNVFGKGGIAYYQGETDYTSVALTDDGYKTHSNLNSFALTYGAGIELNWDQFGVRADYTVVAPNHNNQDNFYISDLIGASIFYRFM